MRRPVPQVGGGQDMARLDPDFVLLVFVLLLCAVAFAMQLM